MANLGVRHRASGAGGGGWGAAQKVLWAGEVSGRSVNTHSRCRFGGSWRAFMATGLALVLRAWLKHNSRAVLGLNSDEG